MTEKNPKSEKFKDLMYAMYLISHSDKKCKAEHSIVNNRNEYYIQLH